MSHYQAYPAYKNSGVEWLGKVPEHWKVSAVKWEFESRLGKMLQPKPNDPKDLEVPYHKAVSVQWERVASEAPESMWASASDIETYQIRKGDLLICEGGNVGRAAIFQSNDSEPLIIQNSIHRVRPKNGNLNDGLLRILQTVRAAGWFDVLCSKATIVHFTGEKLGSLAYPVAPVAEQRAIATHLDRETFRIDRLVTKKIRFIELLREKRQALITHAITKGLDPNVRMKNSGVEWLGAVPKEWVITPVKYCLHELVDTEHKTIPFVSESEYLVVRTSNIRNGKLVLNEIKCTDSKSFEEWTRRATPKPGDIIFTREAPAGEACVVPQGLNVCLGQRTVLMRTNQDRVLPEFLLLTLYAGIAKKFIDEMSQGSIVSHFNMGEIRNLPVLLPSLEDQQAIVVFLNRETLRVDTLISKTERSIELLKERRIALIIAAITGQIDVRDNTTRQDQLAA